MGDMFGQINNILDTTMGDLFQQLNNIQGGGIGGPSKAFQKGINFANILTNALNVTHKTVHQILHLLERVVLH